MISEISDVFSCRILFGSGLFLSGLLNIGFKRDIQVSYLYSFSFLIGLVQGPAWPCCGKLLQNWLPKSQFGTWWSILSTSSNVAGSLGPIIATSIALNYHWSYGFMIPGCISMTVGYLAIIVLRNRPSEVGLTNYEETNVGNKTKTENENVQLEELGFKTKSKMLLSYPFFISICLCYFMVQLIKTLFSDWSQIYLIKSFKISNYNASYFLSIFEFSGIFGSVFSGILSDCIYYAKTKRYEELISKEKTISQQRPSSVKIRMGVNFIFFLGLILSLNLFNYFLHGKISLFFLLSIAGMAGFFSYGCISLLGVIAMEFTPKSFSGTSHAFASLAANFGAITAGIPFGYISKLYTWSYGFKLTEFSAIGVCFFLMLCWNSKSKLELVNINRKKQ
ncbi:unnamed protein product [Brachionus calyciflorus]|uniref:Major facilitator superfamily (MFS) profile domain-containing protein n=1 Tax=Brachionus calyciflorus TaxID=104777 RepID=A0A814G7B9_9BILA|nr:unnamed protein product [Brachionus calyciflorus]